MVGIVSADILDRWSPTQAMCRYPESKLIFRGPKKNLRHDYMACLGGTETFGRFVTYPFPHLLEETLGMPCVNLGWPNAGIDVLLYDQGLRDVASAANLAVLQVPCAINMTNRYYKVHKRRNDRFLVAKEPLRALFPEVDFMEFNFTRHMLLHLRSVSVERFVNVHAELASTWVAGMIQFVKAVETPVVLFWFSDRKPDHRSNDPSVHYDPALVTRDMLLSVRPFFAGLVEYEIPGGAHADKVEQGQVKAAIHEYDLHAARELPGQRAHKRAAKVLIPSVKELLEM